MNLQSQEEEFEKKVQEIEIERESEQMMIKEKMGKLQKLIRALEGEKSMIVKQAKDEYRKIAMNKQF